MKPSTFPRSRLIVPPRHSSRAPLIRTAWALIALCLHGAATDLAAQACPDGRISYVFVDNHSIFDTSEMGEEATFLWAYELANRLHVETRSSFVRSELLFQEGDCFDPLLLEESERILRNYGFIARVDVFGVRQPDGSVHVVVDTQDEWTTKVDLGLAFENGLQLEGLELAEENLAGRGIMASAFFRERRERRDLGMTVQSPRLLSTRTNGFLSVGRTRVGTFLSQGLVYPFVGEIGRIGGRQLYGRRESVFPYSVEDGGRLDHVLLPLERESVELTAAARVGEPGNLTVFGLGVLRESLTFEGFPGDAELARDQDYSGTVPASPAQIDALSGHVRPTTIFRLNLLFGQRNVRFIQRTGLDALDGVQDVRLGTEIALTLGRALGDVGSGDAAAPDDLYTRLFAFGAWAPGDWLVASNANVEGRVVLPDAAADTEMRDLLGDVDVYLYHHDEGASHTVFGRVSGAGGWSVQRPFQLTLGGRTGVRGYRETRFPGARRLIVSVEDRIRFDWPAPDFADFGATVFADAGRMWAGGVPFGLDTSWRAAMGAGIRLGFPAGSRGVLRADIAIPLKDGGLTEPVFRVSLHEILGLSRGFADEEMTRSRRPAVGADLLTGEVR